MKISWGLFEEKNVVKIFIFNELYFTILLGLSLNFDWVAWNEEWKLHKADLQKIKGIGYKSE